MEATTLRHDTKTVGIAAVEIVPGRSRRSVIVQNLSTNDVYVGGSGVTTANGIKIIPGASATIYTSASVYAIASGAGSDVRYLEEA
ncbi:MAG: hypothetical protein HY770_06310 [Chitinivibrionia bacterium]|nr:hypothetical protein [Chitinivibrionia bacterium]